MIALIFGFIALCFALVALYFFWRWLLHRNPISLGLGFLPVGWVLAVARELGWLPRDITTFLLCAAFSVGIFLCVVIYHFESTQPYPFR